MESLIGAIITGVLALIGVIITNNSANKELISKQNTAQAVTNEKISQLTAEVAKHNNFAQRVPVIEEQIKVINHRISDLEDKTK